MKIKFIVSSGKYYLHPETGGEGAETFRRWCSDFPVLNAGKRFWALLVPGHVVQVLDLSVVPPHLSQEDGPSVH